MVTRKCNHQAFTIGCRQCADWAVSDGVAFARELAQGPSTVAIGPGLGELLRARGVERQPSASRSPRARRQRASMISRSACAWPVGDVAVDRARETARASGLTFEEALADEASPQPGRDVADAAAQRMTGHQAGCWCGDCRCARAWALDLARNCAP